MKRTKANEHRCTITGKELGLCNCPKHKAERRAIELGPKFGRNITAVKAGKKILKKAAKELSALAAVAPVRLSKKALRKQSKERVAHLERQGMTRKQAKEVVAHTEKLAPEGAFIPGMIVQFNLLGLRLGYVADVPHAGAVRIQPIGPKGSELPSRVTVRLSDVHAVDEQYLKHGENTMTAINAKAKELKAQGDAVKEAKAAKLAENLGKAQAAKKAKTATAKNVAPKAPAKKAKKEGIGRKSFEETAKIVAGKESPYREGSARAELLAKALKGKTVGGFLKIAGEPSGGSPTSYLHLFVREGVIKIG